MKRIAGLCLVSLVGMLVHVQAQNRATPCERLAALALPNTTITSAETVPAGKYGDVLARGATAPPAASPFAIRLSKLPAFCRVVATLTPSSDSDIQVEIWLPAAEWNGKFLAAGNGGWAGFIQYNGLTAAIEERYATASTDTGHRGSSAAFLMGHPEKLVDFAYRAVHEMSVSSKGIITAFYGRAPRLSYWNGCSTGGRQGLMEASRYPDDFDGIIAGAPANNQTKLCAWRLAVESKILQQPSSVVPPSKLALVNAAVLSACDPLDGVADGLLADPHRCRFDPARLLCRGDDDGRCLTAPQVEAVKMGYAPAKRRNGDLIYPGLVPGGETGWVMLTAANPEPGSIDVGMFRYAAHQDPGWDWRTFDLDRDTALVDERAGVIDVTNPDLSAFKARGGKLLIYHGWNDGGSGGAISPQNSINYYSSILKKMGPRQDGWLRLFMVQGMAHCGGGPGPNQVNWLGAMERWRESGVAPDRVLATRVTDGRVDMTRPICPYPQLARYSGVGSTNDAGNFACKEP
jgi:feruloyl esterase